MIGAGARDGHRRRHRPTAAEPPSVFSAPDQRSRGCRDGRQAASMSRMLPLSDGIPARRFPIVNVALIAANFAVWIFYELPHMNSSIYHASFYPCTVNGSCHGPEPWEVSWITAMFLHGSWDHILGNMVFLVIFGKNVESAFGHFRYLVFYFAGGLAATAVQTAATLAMGSAA